MFYRVQDITSTPSVKNCLSCGATKAIPRAIVFAAGGRAGNPYQPPHRDNITAPFHVRCTLLGVRPIRVKEEPREARYLHEMLNHLVQDRAGPRRVSNNALCRHFVTG